MLRALLTKPIIQRSWERAASRGLPRDVTPAFERVSEEELRRRQNANALLVGVASPHLEWLARSFCARNAVAYLVDREGVVLTSYGDAASIAAFGLAPGYDWSEQRMGTNGAGTALVEKQAVAVVGCEHWSAAWHNATCLGAPVFGPDDELVGAIDVTLTASDDDDERLALAAYAAYAISQEYSRRLGESVHGLLLEHVERLERAEDQLRESQARFRVMADTSPVMIWVTDQRGDIEFVNKAYREFFGVTEEQVSGPGGWLPLVHPDDAASYSNAFYEALRGRRPLFAETRVRRKDGEWRWIASYGGPRRADDGRVIGFVGSSPDITELKRALAQAHESRRTKDEFLATVAHELRQPIHAAMAALQIMTLRPGREKGQHARTVLDRQLHHMNRLVEDLLEASRVVRGNVQVRLQPTDLRSTIRNVTDALRAQFVERAHILDVQVPDNPVRVLADDARLQQVLGNVLTNAARYSDAGGHISLTLTAGEHARIAVRDRGRGIAPDMLPRVFELFTRGEDDHRGFGIGLAIARRLIELHGGTIDAFSEGLGKGAEFVITLPLSQAGAGTISA